MLDDPLPSLIFGYLMLDESPGNPLLSAKMLDDPFPSITFGYLILDDSLVCPLLSAN